METALMIWWMAGVVCGISVVVGLVSFFWAWRKKYKMLRMIPSLLAIVVGSAGLINSIYSILRLRALLAP